MDYMTLATNEAEEKVAAEMNRRKAILDAATALYNDGFKTIIATMDDGEERTLRLFMKGDFVCYYAPRKQRYGYYLSNLVTKIVAVRGKDVKKELTARERQLKNLKNFKRAFTSNVHPNLWSELQAGYAKLDLDEFDAFVETNWDGDNHDLWRLLGQWAEINDIELITENHYKTTTIRSNPADWRRGHGYADYNACVANIERHLENKETFSYHWRSASYDVSVSGKVRGNGEYAAWLSLEFKGMGNGHYYLLINENTAVFGEDD